MGIQDIKIFVIHNSKPIYEAIDVLFQNSNYQNHLEYWQEYLSKKTYRTVTLDDLYQNTRNMIAIKIALEGNIVFIDTSKQNEKYRSGIMFLPSNISYTRKKLAMILTSSYDYINIVYDIFYDGITYRAKERSIDRSAKLLNCPKRVLKSID